MNSSFSKRPRILPEADGEVRSLEESVLSLPSPGSQPDSPTLAVGSPVEKHAGYEIVRDIIKRGDVEALAQLDPAFLRTKTEILFAANLGKTRVVEWLVRHGYATVKNTDLGSAALHLASAQGHFETVLWLANEGAIVAQGGIAESQSSSLMDAAFHGHLDIVRCLIYKARASVDEVSASGITALALTAVHGRLEVAKLLVKEGANINHRSKLGFTPVHAAAKNGHLEFLKWLVYLGVNPDEASYAGSTPLTLAASCGHVEIVRWLIGRKAHVNHRTQDGVTSAGRAAHAGQLEVLKVLVLEGHAQVKSVTNAGKSCLSLATQNGRLAVVQWFVLDRGESVNCTDELGCTMIALASKCGHLHIVRWLLLKGAAVERMCAAQRTPLLWAAEYGHVDVVKCLVLEGSAKVDYITPKGENGVNLACSRGHLDVLKFLVRAGATLTPTVGKWSTLGIAAALGHLELVQFLVAEGNVEVDQLQNDGRLPLDLAAQKGHIEVVRWLLHEGRASVKLIVGCSALQLALNEGHAKVIRLLIGAGAKLTGAENVASKQAQGLLLDALDKARIKRIRQVLCPLGWDRAITSLVGRYSMVSWPEAVRSTKED